MLTGIRSVGDVKMKVELEHLNLDLLTMLLPHKKRPNYLTSRKTGQDL